jgi:ElaB/YqjD/DUF883 family membrane-anchored ribosome-binding protein
MAKSQPLTPMTNDFTSPAPLEPEAGFGKSASVKQAADELRAAAGDLRAAASERAREFVHTAGDQAKALTERAAEKAQQFKAAAADKAGEWKSFATEKAGQLRESASEHWQETRDKARDIHISAEDYIRQHPTKCVLGALGIGFLIGLIVRR